MNHHSKPGMDATIAIAGLSVILIVLVMSFLEFADQCFTYTYDAQLLRLGEIANRNRDSIRVELVRANEIVRNAALSFSHIDDLASEEAFEILKIQGEASSFESLLVVTPDGAAHDGQGLHTDVAFAGFHPLVSVFRNEVSASHPLNEGCRNKFSIFSPIMAKGEYRGGVLGVIRLACVDSKEDTGFFNGTGYHHIVDSKGRFIIKSENVNRLVDRDNIMDFFQNVEFLSGFTFDDLREAMENDRRAAFAYRYNGHHRLAYSTPLGINDWFTITVGTEDVISSFSDDINTFAALLVLKVTLCFLALIGGVVLLLERNRRRTVAANRQLGISNQRFRIAAFQLSNEVIEYDIAKDALHKANENLLEEDGRCQVADLGADLLTGAVVDKEYLPVLKTTLRKLRHASPFESCIIKAWAPDKRRKWFKLSFTTIFIEDKVPVQAIGTIEDISTQKETEITFAHKERHRLAMMADVMETFVFNVSQGRYLYGYRTHECDFRRPDTLYASKLDLFVNKNVHPAYQRKVNKALSAGHLKNVFRNGVSRTEIEFRGLNGPDGEERWLRCTTNLILDPETNDIMGYAYIGDITQSKLRERELQFEAERDAMTGLYNRSTLQKRVEQHLAAGDPRINNRLSAFILIDLDNFKYVNDTYGHRAGDEVLKAMAEKLTGIFRASDFVGRLGGDEFVVFVANAPNYGIILDGATRLCASLKTIVFEAAPDHRVSGSVGVCIVDRLDTTWTEMYEKAGLALYAAKRDGKDRFKVYDDALVAECAVNVW